MITWKSGQNLTAKKESRGFALGMTMFRPPATCQKNQADTKSGENMLEKSEADGPAQNVQAKGS